MVDEKNECIVLNCLIDYIMLQSKKEIRFAGEFTTDANLSKLMASICQIKSGMNIYDFACGYSILLALAIEGKEVDVYAQDINHVCSAISAMLLIIGFNDKVNIFCSNSLQHPITMLQYAPKKFDIVLSTPPLGIKVYPMFGKEYELEEAFMYGFDLTTKGDLVFVQHLLASLNDDGKGALLLPMGALFRRGREETLRKKIIEDGFVRAVIELPVGSLAPYSGVKTAIVLFSKRYKSNKVLFVNLDSNNAKGYIERNGRASVKITDEGVANISKIVIEDKLIDGISKEVNIQEIINNGSNLCPGAYLNIHELEDIKVKDTERLLNKNTILINKLTDLDR